MGSLTKYSQTACQTVSTLSTFKHSNVGRTFSIPNCLESGLGGRGLPLSSAFSSTPEEWLEPAPKWPLDVA